MIRTKFWCIKFWRRAAAAVLWAAMWAAVGSPPANAETYDVPILIDTDQDIWDLEANGEITSEERDRLLALYDAPVDINKANRDALYELPNVTYSMVDAILKRRAELGRFPDVYALSAVEGLPQEIYMQILPFVQAPAPRVVDAPGKPFQFRGHAESGVADIVGVDGGPTMYAQTEFVLDEYATVGWIGFLEDTPGNLGYVSTPGGENTSPYFVADPVALRFDALTKLYAYTEQDIGKGMTLSALAGSYVIGFGERLNLDTTQRSVRPYGWYADDIIVSRPQSGDYSIRNGLFGGVVTLAGVPVAESLKFDVTAFASYQQIKAYQYDFNITSIDEDGFREFDSPTVYFNSGDAAALGPTSCSSEGRCHTFATFPDAYKELIVGGNTTLFVGNRSQFGLTGFYAKNTFTVGDDRVVFAPSARNPIRRDYFVLGADGAFGMGPVDVFAELSFMDNGGFAGVVRALLDFEQVFIELTGRYFDEKYDNPRTRARAQPDEFLGSRTRDEAGGRFKIIYTPVRWINLQSYVDIWTRPLAKTTNLEYQFQASWEIHKGWRLSSAFNLRDKDITQGGRDQSYDQGFTYDFSFVDLVAADDFSNTLVSGGGRGTLLNWRGRLSVTAIPLTTLVATYRVQWRDIGTAGFENSFEKSFMASLLATVRPIRGLKLSARFRVSDDDFDHIERGEALWDLYGQIATSPVSWLDLQFRYDYRDYFDERADPRPSEHLVRAKVEARW